MVRAKMMLVAVTENSWSRTARKLLFSAQYDSTIPEDQKYALATPSGSIEMLVDNPKALEQFQIGKQYYVDFTPAD